MQIIAHKVMLILVPINLINNILGILQLKYKDNCKILFISGKKNYRGANANNLITSSVKLWKSAFGKDIEGNVPEKLLTLKLNPSGREINAFAQVSRTNLFVKYILPVLFFAL